MGIGDASQIACLGKLSTRFTSFVVAAFNRKTCNCSQQTMTLVTADSVHRRWQFNEPVFTRIFSDSIVVFVLLFSLMQLSQQFAFLQFKLKIKTNEAERN